MKKKNYLLYTLLFCCFLILFCKQQNMFGSTTDWLSQHSVFPEYFRTLFYKTGNLFPDLAPHLGGGQNIFNFSYYGLFNPIYMFSYLLPWVSMTDYIMFISIILTLIGTGLIYYFLKDKVNNKLSFLGSILYFSASPIIFHAHRHLMFVNYMPFLILALIGVDRYFNKKKSLLLTISIFLMFLSSYYYSIGGCLTIALYAIYKYLKITPKVTTKDFIINALKFMIPCILGVLLSSFLLLPTLHVIINSRTGLNESISLQELILPTINLKAILYDNYSLGLTSISIFALIGTLFFKKKEDRFLNLSLIIILIFPIITYLLNGTLYIRSKVLIPLLPLFILIIVNFIYKIKDINKKYFLILIALINTIILIFGYNNNFYYIDLLITLASLLLFSKVKKEYLLLPLIFISIFNVVTINQKENYVTYDNYNKIFDDTAIINEIVNNDNSLYRFNNIDDISQTINKIYNSNYYSTSLYSSTYNNYYKNFLENELKVALPLRNILDQAQTDNILLQTFMGVKYIKTNNPSLGFINIKDDIYKNIYAYPIGYATDKLTNINEYENINYPYNLEYLMNSIITNNKSTYISNNLIEPYNINLDGLINYEKVEDNYLIKTNENKKITLELIEPINDILIIKFDLLNKSKCSDGDLSIDINGVTNKLTCSSWMYYNNNESFEYTISSNEPITKLEITFSKGEFLIGNIETYRMKEVTNLNYDVFNPAKYGGDTLEGDINVTNTGYFMFTIPYDKGYTLYLDGKEIEYELVNKAFIGFPIDKGSHKIKLVYNAPLFKEGKITSMFSLFGIVVLFNRERKRT